MNNLLNCEFKKLIKNNKNKLVILLLIFYFVGFVVFYYYSDRNYITETEIEMRHQRNQAKSRIAAINNAMEFRKRYNTGNEIDLLELELLYIEEKT